MGRLMARFRHVALNVPDLRDAEDYYAALFGMTVLFREAHLREGEAATWATLPPDRGWDDAAAAGVTLGMVALQRDDLILALFPGAWSGEQINKLGIVMDDQAIDEVAARLPTGTSLVSHRCGSLEFLDRYRIRWQLSSRSTFRSSGDMFGSWLDIGRAVDRTGRYSNRSDQRPGSGSSSC